MEKEHLKSNLQKKSTWNKVMYILLFSIFYSVAIYVFVVVVLFQIIFSLITGTTNERTRRFTSQLSRYMYDTLLYMGFSTDKKPWPFSDFPEADVMETLDDTPLPQKSDDT